MNATAKMPVCSTGGRERLGRLLSCAAQRCHTLWWRAVTASLAHIQGITQGVPAPRCIRPQQALAYVSKPTMGPQYTVSFLVRWQ